MPTTPRPIVLVDMDGVLADFDAEIFRKIQVTNPTSQFDRTRLNFYINEDYPEHDTLIRQISHSAGFFAALPVLAGALEGWQRLIDLGYHPRICTAPIRSNKYSESEKRAWLRTHFAPHFGDSIVQEAIVSRDKYLFDGIALIDDRPVIRGSERASWQHILFNKPYNSSTEGLRLFGWQDRALGNLLNTCAERYEKQ